MRRVIWLALFAFGCCVLAAVRLQAAPLEKDQTAAGSSKEKLAAEASNDTSDDDAITDLRVAALTKKYPNLAPAWDKLRNDDTDGALEILRSAALHDPLLPPAEVLIAVFYLELHNGNAAYHWLDQATLEHADDANAYLILGNIATGQNRLTDATLLFERGEKLLNTFSAENPRLTPLRVRLLKNQAQIDIQLQRWNQARSRLEQVVKLAPGDGSSFYRLGNMLLRLGERANGYEALKIAYKLNQKLPTPPIAVAMFCLDTKQQELADKWMLFAESQFGNDVPTRMTLGSWAWQFGRSDDAKRHGATAAKLDPKLSTAQTLLGLVAHYEGDLKTARQRFEAALSLAPDDMIARNHLVMVLIASEAEPDHRKAYDLAEENVNKFPNEVEPIAALGWVQFNTGRKEQAMRTLGVAMRGNLTPDAAYFIAQVMSETTDKDKAPALLKNVLSSKALFVHRKAAEKLLKDLQP